MFNVLTIQNQSTVGANPCVRPARTAFLEMNQLDLIKMIQREFQFIFSQRTDTGVCPYKIKKNSRLPKEIMTELQYPEKLLEWLENNQVILELNHLQIEKTWRNPHWDTPENLHSGGIDLVSVNSKGDWSVICSFTAWRSGEFDWDIVTGINSSNEQINCGSVVLSPSPFEDRFLEETRERFLIQNGDLSPLFTYLFNRFLKFGGINEI